jgi:hypothetical protein
MPDFSKSKIYKLISNNPEITSVYYGSTTQKLCARMSTHRAHYKSWCNGKVGSCSIFEYFKQYGIEQFHIELVEDFPCDNKQQLFSRENEFIRGFDCINKNSTITTPEEKKQYHQQYNKQYNLDHADELKQYRSEHVDEVKQYQLDHADELKDYQKQYYSEHADDISIKNKETIVCQCGCFITTGFKLRHIKTNKHKKLMSKLELK